MFVGGRILACRTVSQPLDTQENQRFEETTCHKGKNSVCVINFHFSHKYVYGHLVGKCPTESEVSEAGKENHIFLAVLKRQWQSKS